MKGYVHITGAEIPPEEVPEGAKASYGFNIRCDCELASFEEILSMVYNLSAALNFGRDEWLALHALAMGAGPYSNVISEHYQLGGVQYVEDGE